MKEMRSLPIGVFDSGIGGLTVVKELMKQLPNEQIIYLGDTARFPYGSKSDAAVSRYCIENTLFLLEQEIKVLVIACNTAASHAAKMLRKLFRIPVIDIVEAGVREAVATTKNRRIAISATPAAIRSGFLQNRIGEIDPNIGVLSLPCPLLAQLVEEGFADHMATRLMIAECLKPLQSTSVDTLLLACTHYPALTPLFCLEAGPDVQIVNPAEACASSVAAFLQSSALNAPSLAGNHRFYVSEDPEKFRNVARQVTGLSIDFVDLLPPRA